MLKIARIVFEDEQILVIDKPAGMVVNRSGTNKEETLQDQLAQYFNLGGDLGIGDRAGIVHRLDRETSGLIVVAKTQKAFDELQAQFKGRAVEKVYVALVHGFVKDSEGSVEARIERIAKFGKFGLADRRSVAGREAKTDYEVIDRYYFQDDKFEEILVLAGQNPARQGSALTKSRLNYLKKHARNYSFLRVYPRTGRTHQIRVHLKSIGHPPVSDLIYTPRKLLKFDLMWCPRLFLHAWRLVFVHPETCKQVKLESDLPNDLKRAILNLDRLTTNA